MTLSQSSRSIQFSSPIGDDGVVAERVHWKEQLGRPFEGLVELACDAGDIDPADIIRQPASIRIGDPDESPSYLHGYVSEFGMTGFDKGLYRYRVKLVPWFALMAHVGGSQIFQNETAITIAQAMIDLRGFSGELEDKTSGTPRTRAYCVQYNESDFRFLSRLFEEEGIYYYFSYSENQHQMVLCDDVGAHVAADGLDTLPYHPQETFAVEACVSRWASYRRFATASHVMSDYDFQKPSSDMTVRQNASDSESDWQWYQHPGRYFETDDGQYYARVRTESVAANQQRYEVDVSTHGVQCGNLLTVKDHPTDELNREYLVVSAELTATAPDVAAGSDSTDGGFKFKSRLSIQSSDVPYRSARTTRRRIMPGPQIATVVGPDGEEIWTDAYGRIKVQFAWDLDAPGDDSSSCWIRVSQPWTGNGWGAVSIPRVGQEVIVEFLDGDVDRPIVTGRVYNDELSPPEALADNQAKTVLRTRSTKGGDVESYHELTFDDTKDAEQILLHSERDFVREVENNDTLKVGFDKSDPGDQSIEIYNDQNVQVGVGSGSGSQTIDVGQDRSVTIDAGDDTIVVKSGDRNVSAEQGAITIEAATSIQLKCGDSVIELTPSGISIKAAQVDVQADTTLNLGGTEVNISADAALTAQGSASAELSSSGTATIKGAMVMIN